MSNASGAAVGVGCVLIAAYGIVQIVAGYVGIQYHFGSGWAIAAIVAAFVFRFSLPMTIGSFLGAMNVWGWHWALALIFAAPGLAFMILMIPGALADMKNKYR